MGTSARKSLIAALRQRISDDRPSVTAFSVAVTGEARSALLEVTNGLFLVTVEGGEKVRSVRFGLTLPNYNTVGKLVAALSRAEGYEVKPDETYQTEHPSIDLVAFDGGIKDISNKQSETLRHTKFSDTELIEFLSDAIAVHNPNYVINTVPPAERVYVLMKAQARAYRVMAGDAVKRRGLDTSAKDFIALAKDLEGQYEKDTKRQARIIPSPKIDESRIHTGDTLQGQFTRRSLRAGYTASYRNATPPETPQLFDSVDDDIEDVFVRLRWRQDRDESFAYYELWRDSVPEVQRHIAGRLEVGNDEPSLPTMTQYSKPGTSRQILGLAIGANRLSPTFDGFFFWTSAELAGSNIVNTTFIDGVVHPNPGATTLSVLGKPLEPQTEYYYRLYTVNWNGEVQHSNVLRVKTKGVRARFDRTGTKALDLNSISPKTGSISGGDSITISGTNIVDGTKAFLNGKLLVEVSRTIIELVVTSPTFTNTDFEGQFADIVLVSPTGLKDIALNAWKFTA